jgi:hypothetical protein
MPWSKKEKEPGSRRGGRFRGGKERGQRERDGGCNDPRPRIS